MSGFVNSVPYSRLWFASASGQPIPGILAEIDLSSPCVQTTGWSVQLNIACADGWLLQPVLQLYYQGAELYACFTNGGTDGISSTHGGTPFDGTIALPLQNTGDGVLLSLMDTGTDMLAMLWARQNGFLHGSPVYNPLGTGSHPMLNVAVDLSGTGGGNRAVFDSASFEVNLKLDGISDITYYGIGPGSMNLNDINANQGIALPTTPPTPASLTSVILNSNEGDNLQRWIASIDRNNAFVQMSYDTP